MLKSLEGAAVASVNGRSHDVHVRFDLERGCCLLSTVKRPQSISLGFELLAAGSNIFLKEVEIGAAGPPMYAKELGPFYFGRFFQSEQSEDKNIALSGIAKLLEVESQTSEIDEIRITPSHSLISFESKDDSLTGESEALFLCEPQRRIDCIIDVDGGTVRVHSFNFASGLSGYVRCVSSDLKLSEHLQALRVGLSLLYRRKAFNHFVRNGRRIDINLTRPDQVTSYGVIVRDPRRYGEVLQKLVAHSPRRQMHFLIEALSNTAPLEVRLLNAFVHLEIIDGGRRLSANQLASTLGMSRESAEALIYVRNRMVHDGAGITNALEECRNRPTSRHKGGQIAKVIEDTFKTDSPHGNFYAALMDTLSIHLASEAGIPAVWIQRTTAVSFE